MLKNHPSAGVYQNLQQEYTDTKFTSPEKPSKFKSNEIKQYLNMRQGAQSQIE